MALPVNQKLAPLAQADDDGSNHKLKNNPSPTPRSISIDAGKKKGTLLIVGLVTNRLTAEFSDTLSEKRGTRVPGANPHFRICGRASNLLPEPVS
jgi:hypothetical protein